MFVTLSHCLLDYWAGHIPHYTQPLAWKPQEQGTAVAATQGWDPPPREPGLPAGEDRRVTGTRRRPC